MATIESLKHLEKLQPSEQVARCEAFVQGFRREFQQIVERLDSPSDRFKIAKASKEAFEGLEMFAMSKGISEDDMKRNVKPIFDECNTAWFKFLADHPTFGEESPHLNVKVAMTAHTRAFGYASAITEKGISQPSAAPKSDDLSLGFAEFDDMQELKFEVDEK